MNDYAKYLKRNKRSDLAEAKLLGLSPETGRRNVWRWRNGVCVPRIETMNAIRRMSKGEVDHASWFKSAKVGK